VTIRQRGFSLLDLMITLSVMIILLSIAVPSMGNLVREHRLTSQANSLLAHLHYARHEAVFRRAHVAACPSLDQQTCSGDNRWDQGWIVFVDANRSGQPDSDQDILRVVQPSENLLMHSAGRIRVRFQPHGGAYGTNLTIRVCDSSGTADPRAVIVSNPGRIRSTNQVDPAECEV